MFSPLQHNSDTLDNYASDCPDTQATPCQNDTEVSSVEQVREIERDVSNCLLGLECDKLR